MSYVALATARFEEMRAFYEHALGGKPLQAWDRPGARGVLLDVNGLRIELLDAAREGMTLGAPAGRTHLVLEVDDVDAFHKNLDLDAPAPAEVSWGARLFRIRDPDGTPVTVLKKKGGA